MLLIEFLLNIVKRVFTNAVCINVSNNAGLVAIKYIDEDGG